MQGRFIALEGPDGVGKSTLAARLGHLTYPAAVARLGADAATGELVFVSRRQISATSTYAAGLMSQLSTVLWHSGDAPDLPDAFWVGVQAAWFTAHATTVVQPLLTAGYDVIVDGWTYKFFSKLLLQGYTDTDLQTIFRRVRMPDAVVLLTADMGALYDRRQARFRPAELGMHAGYTALSRVTFIDYQQQGLDNLLTYAARHGWRTVALDPGSSIEACVSTLAPVITEIRAATRGSATRRP
ncbi:dTMP kinase [Micromonospora matsumotoense]|uniref:dTMP kinase n=1 Tax=Micromonospora matsumotoense TaxID=121616 RepID=UPI00340C47A8